MLVKRRKSAFLILFFSVIKNFSDADLKLTRAQNAMLNNTLEKVRGFPHVNKNSKEKVQSYMDCFNLRNVVFVILFHQKNI